MRARLTQKPEHDVIAAIHALDLESVKLRVMDSELGEGWTREYADSIEAAYKTYLTMLVKYPDDAEDILLGKDVDEFWHAHILHTIKYAEDCQNVFGNFLHHNPHIGERTPADIERKAALTEKTRRLYQREFENVRAATWAGAATRVEKAAYCGAAIRTANTAYCGATVRTDHTAYCGAAIKSDHAAAYCGAAIRTAHTAYCGATVRTDHTAYCGATVRTDHTAYCGAAIRADHAAYCGAATVPERTRLA